MRTRPRKTLPLLLLAAALLSGCAFTPPRQTPAPLPGPVPAQSAPEAESEKEPAPLERMGYTIQVGAFSSLENAVRLEQLLDAQGLDAYYFRHESGLYKVRFGNHPLYGAARAQAEHLQGQGVIDSFFIVPPEKYAAGIPLAEQEQLRAELVETARRFIGTPYRWGGTDIDDGFDCSGLTMVCYRLNGLNLPRVSGNQFRTGRWVPKEALKAGDLVFFATNGGDRISHVGMYIGEGKFIHAPRPGKTVRVAELADPFFEKTYMGGRSYL